MKKMKAIILGAVLTCIIGVTASAASFSFTFNNAGTDYSTAGKTSKTFAAVQVSTAPSTATYKYAVAKGIMKDYVTKWKKKKGTGGLDLPYYDSVANGTSVRLHGATVSASGTTTVKGTWKP